MTENTYDLEDELEDILEAEELDIEKIKLNLHLYNTETICEIIVCNRYLNVYNELTVLCMNELSSRRVNGDNFDFEKHIDNSLNALPKININIPDIGTLFGIKK